MPFICVVEDNNALRDALTMLLEAESFRVCGYACGAHFLDDLPRSKPDCVVLDCRLPDMGGLDIHARMAALGRYPPVVFLTGYGDVPGAVRAMRQGAVDFISKPASNERLLEAIAEAITITQRQSWRRDKTARYTRSAQKLTARECEVLDAISRGSSNKTVATTLGISPRTVEAHRETVMRKLGVATTAEMMQAYLLTEDLRAEKPV